MSAKSRGKCLVVGLGNPGQAYAMTRHNLGARAVRLFALQQRWSFHAEKSVEGAVAQGAWSGLEVIVLLPATYMNSSGTAVQKGAELFGVTPNEILVVVDDVALPFGKLRVRQKGSAGGHNGLKSIESHLLSRQYARLRIGIGDRLQGELTHHVLGPFTPEEEAELPKVMEQTLRMMEEWINQRNKD